jgi:DNA-binding PadR family transcriptional regulator
MGKDNRGNWVAKKDYEKNLNKLRGLLLKDSLTYTQIKNILKVANNTLTKYLTTLEKSSEIEFFQKEDRRVKYYRVKPKKKQEVQFKLDKQLLKDVIEGIEYIDVIHFLQDFTMDLVMLYRGAEIRSDEDMKALVEEAKKLTFETLYSGK